MHQDSKVSVILPTYNRAKYLARAIESVLSQTYKNLELLIVNDASEDDTIAVLRQFVDPRIKVLNHEKNRGGAAARNTGIAIATGDFIAFQDSDDTWVPHKLQTQIDALNKMPGAGAVFCPFIRVERKRAVLFPQLENIANLPLMLAKENIVSTQTLIVRRDVIERVNGFDETFPRFQDWDLVLRLSLETKFAYVSEPLAIVYQTEGNISSVAINDAIARERIARMMSSLLPFARKEFAYHSMVAGRIFLWHGRYDEAFMAMRRAISATPLSPLLWLRLGKALTLDWMRGRRWS